MTALWTLVNSVWHFLRQSEQNKPVVQVDCDDGLVSRRSCAGELCEEFCRRSDQLVSKKIDGDGLSCYRYCLVNNITLVIGCYPSIWKANDWLFGLYAVKGTTIDMLFRYTDEKDIFAVIHAIQSVKWPITPTKAKLIFHRVYGWAGVRHIEATLDDADIIIGSLPREQQCYIMFQMATASLQKQYE